MKVLKVESSGIVEGIRKIVPKEYKDFDLEHPKIEEQVVARVFRFPFITSLEYYNVDLLHKRYTLSQIQIEVSLSKTGKPYTLTVL